MLKAVGITRKIDPLGRLVIPKELRRSLGLEIGTGLDIYEEGKYIILRKADADKIGVVRKVDELGRIVLPIEKRRKFELEANVDAVEIFIDGEEIVLKKYIVEGKCAVTGEVSRHNKQYAGVWLSEEGKEIMLNELKNA